MDIKTKIGLRIKEIRKNTKFTYIGLTKRKKKNSLHTYYFKTKAKNYYNESR
jgi:hypothetical protein